MPAWNNRIVGKGVEPAGSFLANEANWRIHPRPQQQAVNSLLEQVGWVRDVLVNLRSSPEWGASQNVQTLLDGHMRVTLALRAGENEPVPVTYVDLKPDEEAMVLALLDTTTGEAVIDREKVDALLHQIQTDAPALQELLSKMAERAGLYFEQADAAGDEINMDDYERQQEQQVYYRVIIDKLCQDEAQEICATYQDAGARVEQYKK